MEIWTKTRTRNCLVSLFVLVPLPTSLISPSPTGCVEQTTGVRHGSPVQISPQENLLPKYSWLIASTSHLFGSTTQFNPRLCFCSMFIRFSRAWPFATPRTVAHHVPLPVEFSRHEYWSGQPFPSPGDLPDPGIKPRSLALQADSLLSEPPGIQ